MVKKILNIIILIIINVNMTTIASTSSSADDDTVKTLDTYSFGRLSHLSDETTHLTIQGPVLSNLNRLQLFPKLLNLDLSNVMYVPSRRDWIDSVITYTPMLISLNLSGWAISDLDLPNVEQLTRLQTINLSSTRMFGSILKQLAQIKNLKLVDLAYTYIDDPKDVREFLSTHSNAKIILHHTDLSESDFEDTARLIFTE